jgi:lysozyme
MAPEEAIEAHDISAAGLRFIGRWEGFRGRLYNDPGGHCTIGYGHLVHHGRCNGSEPARFKQGISQAEGLALLRDDAAGAARTVGSAVRVALNQHQFDALASFTFNVGSGAFQGSTLLALLNRGDYQSVPAQMRRWVNSGGQPVPGLVARRRSEGELFSHGRYDALVEAEGVAAVPDDPDPGDTNPGA